MLLLVLAGVGAYWNSFDGAFVYDDTKHVVKDAKVRAERPLRHILKARRPVVELSLAFNYRHAKKGDPTEEAPGGTIEPWGYHLFNLIIHLLAGLTLFGIVRRTVQLGSFREPLKQSSHWFAFAVTLLWLVHPLQTQSVTYVIQRGESMMGLFYLLTLYCVLRGATSSHARIAWYAAAIAACGLGNGSKAVIVTATLTVLIYDRVFLARSFAEIVRKRWMIYIALAGVTLIVLRLTGVAKGVLAPETTGSKTVGFGYEGISPFEYLLTEAQIIPHYLKLSFWPLKQALDYSWAPVKNLADLSVTRLIVEFALPGTLVLLLLAGTMYALWRKPWLGFLGAWFFVILSPTSSFIPIKDPIYEHRMYLPLAAVIVATLAGVWWGLQWLTNRYREDWTTGESPRIGSMTALVCVLPAAALGYLTHERNKVYFTPLAVWYDSAENYPENARAHNNLGKHLLDSHEKLVNKNKKLAQARLDEAIQHLREATRLDPSFMRAHYNLGNGLRSNKQFDEAIKSYEETIRRAPHYIEAQIMLGNALTDKGDLPGAEAAFRKAIKLKDSPRRIEPYLIARSYFNLGNTLFRLKQFKEARGDYYNALKYNGKHFKSWHGIGMTSEKLGEMQEAVKGYREALKLNPGHLKSIYQLGYVYQQTNQGVKALEVYERLLTKRPRDTTALYRIGTIHAAEGRRDQAKMMFEKVLQIKPDHPWAKKAIQNLNARRSFNPTRRD